METLVLTDKISQASTASKDQKFLVSEYGDGYEQRVAIGVNSMFMTWNIQWNMLSLADRNTLIAFWNRHGRVNSFQWTPPNETLGTYVFSSALNEGNVGVRYNISIQLKQVFE